MIESANDNHPFVGQDAEVVAFQNHTNPYSSEQEPMLARRRGIGLLQIDYSSSCYEMWKNVVKFAFCQAKSVERGRRRALTNTRTTFLIKREVSALPE